MVYTLLKGALRRLDQYSFDFMSVNCSFGNKEWNMKRNLMISTIRILLGMKDRKNPTIEYLPFSGKIPHFLALKPL